jgi:hypothetical protein
MTEEKNKAGSKQTPIQKLDDLNEPRIIEIGIRKVPGDSKLLLVNETDKKLIATYNIEGSNTSHPTFPKVPDDSKDQKYI